MIWEGGNQKVTREHAAGIARVTWTNTIRTAAAPTPIAAPTRPPAVHGCQHRHRGRPRNRQPAGGRGRIRSRGIAAPRLGRLFAAEFRLSRGQGPDDYELTSEQYAVNEVGQYVSKVGAPDHCGGANWIFSDSTSGGRDAAEVARASGEVDGVRLAEGGLLRLPDDVPRRSAGAHHRPLELSGRERRRRSTSPPIGEDVELFVNGRITRSRHGVRSLSVHVSPTSRGNPAKSRPWPIATARVVATNAKHTVGPPVGLAAHARSPGPAVCRRTVRMSR